MEKRQRVINAIRGEKVDFVPTCFSLHFDKSKAFGAEGVSSHLQFFKETDTDIEKIMNEHLVPFMGHIRIPDDWNQIRNISLNDHFMKEQLSMVDQILQSSDSSAFRIGTLHGVVASAIHPIEAVYGYEKVRELLCSHLREKSQPVLDAFKRIAEGMCRLAEKYINMGLDGIYYAALGGESYYFTDEEFEKHIAPLDKMILEATKKADGTTILHMCKNHLNLDRYQSYTSVVDVFNWGIYEDNIMLDEGRALFKDKAIMGGLQNRAGVVVDGSKDELADEVKRIIKNQETSKFILGADCTLATEMPYDRIKLIVDTARSI
ncbi:MAG: uroporphyrinogen III decarboxylase [Clostridia bacterium]|nr:uroporphyrinogen III decarboxylase [Clostridia bacterium]